MTSTLASTPPRRGTAVPDGLTSIPVDAGHQRPRIEFVAALRAVGALMVVWCHLVGPGTVAGVAWAPGAFVNRWVTLPFGITQNFGFLGVCVFFLISGFIISHVLGREGRGAFVTKRVFRIYPPLLAAIVVTLLVEVSLRPALGLQAGFPAPDLPHVLRAVTLTNYVYVDQGPIVAVAWTLAIEMLFYAACFALLPLLRHRPRVAVVALLATVVATRLVEPVLPAAVADNWHLLAQWMGYVPLLVLGQVRYLSWARRIDLRSTLVLSVASAAVFAQASDTILRAFYAPTLPVVSVVYAYVIFSGAIALGERIWFPRALQFISTISYSLYLVHMPVGRTVEELVAVSWGLPASLALVTAFAVSVAVAWGVWLLVERPAQQCARWVLGRRRKRARDTRDGEIRTGSIESPERPRATEDVT